MIAWFIAAPILGVEVALAFIAIRRYESEIVAWLERLREKIEARLDSGAHRGTPEPQISRSDGRA